MADTNMGLPGKWEHEKTAAAEKGEKQSFTSIILLTCNNFIYTKRCIQSIRKYTKAGTYEIIVIDNHSTDNTVAWLKKQPDIRLEVNEENVGFPMGCNQGIKMALGDFVLLLNNDTVVTEHWLHNLLLCLTGSAEIGAVGPVTNYCSNQQQIEVTYTKLSDMQKFASGFNKTDSSKWEFVLKLVGYCMLFKREVFETVGLLDERFTPGNFEDDDISVRMLKAGYKLVLCRDTFIHHYGSVSFRQNVDAFAPCMQTNCLKFIEKWGFNPRFEMVKKEEIVRLIKQDADKAIKVLQVGCSCGATLLAVKNRYKNARIFGMEANRAAAAIAGTFARVAVCKCGDDTVAYPACYFDYILFTDILENLSDPWSVLHTFKKYLRVGGTVLASVPNVMHYSVVAGLLNGRWNYTDSGILNKKHLRFFTPAEVQRMFAAAGYENITLGGTVLPDSPQAVAYVDKLGAFAGEQMKPFFTIYQLQVSAQSTDNPVPEPYVWMKNIEEDVAGNKKGYLDETKENLTADELIHMVGTLDEKLWAIDFDLEKYDSINLVKEIGTTLLEVENQLSLAGCEKELRYVKLLTVYAVECHLNLMKAITEQKDFTAGQLLQKEKDMVQQISKAVHAYKKGVCANE